MHVFLGIVIVVIAIVIIVIIIAPIVIVIIVITLVIITTITITIASLKSYSAMNGGGVVPPHCARRAVLPVVPGAAHIYRRTCTIPRAEEGGAPQSGTADILPPPAKPHGQGVKGTIECNDAGPAWEGHWGRSSTCTPPPLVIATQKSQINMVPMPTVAWTRAWLLQRGGGYAEGQLSHPHLSKICSPVAWDKQCKQPVPDNPNRCVCLEAPTGTLTQPFWQPPTPPAPPKFLGLWASLGMLFTQCQVFVCRQLHPPPHPHQRVTTCARRYPYTQWEHTPSDSPLAPPSPPTTMQGTHNTKQNMTHKMSRKLPVGMHVQLY